MLESADLNNVFFMVAFHTMQQIIVLPISSCCLKMTDSESSVVFRVVWQGLSMNKIMGLRGTLNLSNI